MKALVYYGPKDLRLSEIEDKKPGRNEVLIKIRACGICGSDIHGYLGITGRRIPPMVMGHEFAGEIVETGEDVVNFKIGDRVTAQPINFCGNCKYCMNGLTNMCTNMKFFGVLDTNGAMAEYLCVPEKLLYKLPENVTYIEAAMVEPFAVAYNAAKKISDIEDKAVLIVGSGTIGLLILNIIKNKKPSKIIVTDLSDFRLSIAKKMGADIIINPSKEDVIKIIKQATANEGVDVAFEAVGATPSVQQAMSALKIGGTCVWVGNSAKYIDINMQEIVTRELKVFGTFDYTHKSFGEALEMIAEGNIDLQSLISKVIKLEEGPEMMEKMSNLSQDMLKVIIS